MKNFKGIIFDLDGTLLNTLADIADAVNSVLQFLELPLHPENEYKSFIGEGIRNLIIKALPNHKREANVIDHALTLLIKEYEQRLDKKTCFYEGIDLLLNYVQEKQIKFSILSNKPHNLTLKTHEKFLSNWNFVSIFGDMDNIPKKPDPYQAINIAKEMKLISSDIIFIGDSKIDMITAKRAGMFALGALWGFGNEKELKENGADYLLKKPIEFIEFIEN